MHTLKLDFSRDSHVCGESVKVGCCTEQNSHSYRNFEKSIQFFIKTMKGAKAELRGAPIS